jgi:hypothetical protein
VYLAVHPALALRIRELAISLALAMEVWAVLLAPIMAISELCALVSRGLLGLAA